MADTPEDPPLLLNDDSFDGERPVEEDYDTKSEAERLHAAVERIAAKGGVGFKEVVESLKRMEAEKAVKPEATRPKKPADTKRVPPREARPGPVPPRDVSDLLTGEGPYKDVKPRESVEDASRGLAEKAATPPEKEKAPPPAAGGGDHPPSDAEAPPPPPAGGGGTDAPPPTSPPPPPADAPGGEEPGRPVGAVATLSAIEHAVNLQVTIQAHILSAMREGRGGGVGTTGEDAKEPPKPAEEPAHTAAGRVWRNIKKWGRQTLHSTKAMAKSSQRAGRAAGSAIGRGVGRLLGGSGKAAGAVGGAIGGGLGAAAGAAVGGVVALGSAAVSAVKAIDSYTASSIAAGQELAKVSGAMAAVMAQREVQELQRDIKRGDATAGTKAELVEAEQGRKDAGFGLSTTLEKVQDKILTKLNDGVAALLGPISDAAEAAYDFFFDEKAKKDDPKMVGLAADAKHMMDMAAKIEAAGRDMMDAAAAAAGKHGHVAPAGALPPGRVAGKAGRL